MAKQEITIIGAIKIMTYMALVENEISKCILTTKKKIDKNKAIEGLEQIRSIEKLERLKKKNY